MSSCGVDEIQDSDAPPDDFKERSERVEKQQKKHLAFPIMWEADVGNSNKYFKIPEGYKRVGDYQYWPAELAPKDPPGELEVKGISEEEEMNVRSLADEEKVRLIFQQ
jgi:hypothetical protein